MCCGVSFDDAVVGAYGVGDYQGAVYVNLNTKIKRAQTVKIIAEDGTPDDHFGYSLAASGGNIAIGAPGDDDDKKGTNSGAVYIHPSGIKVTAEDGAANDGFGYFVALSNAALVVGALFDDYCGSAYVFMPDGTGGYVQTKKLTADDGESGDNFGYAVAITDMKIFVGAPTAPLHGVTLSGAVYQYDLSGDYIDKFAGQGSDMFGYSLAASNEVLAVGAPGYPLQGSGKVYIHKDNSDMITISNPDTVKGFGSAVSISEDTLVVGTEYGNKAYVYDLSTIVFLGDEEA